METKPHQQGALREVVLGASRGARFRAIATLLVLCASCAFALCTAASAVAEVVDVEAPEVIVAGGGDAVIPHEVKGVRVAGSILSCNAGDWEGTGLFSYEWLRDGFPVKGGGAHPDEFIVTAEDHDATISCIVTGESGAEKLEEESWNIICVEGPCTSTGSPPKNEVPPEIDGEAALEKTLTCTSGTWSGNPRPTYEYEWLQEGVSVGQGSTYKVSSSNLGHTLECRVTATNSEGHASAPSKTVKVKGSAPANTTKPELLPASTEQLGETVTCYPGKWTGAPSPTFSYVWLLTIGSSTKTIENAVAETFVVQEADEGGSLSCEVTASNLEGDKSAKSANSEPVAETAPKAISAPAITGDTTVGSKLTCEPGEWRPDTSALKFTYQWLRGSEAISGAESSTYTIQTADEAQTLTCEVTATNGSKKTSVATSPGVDIPGVPPKDEVLPSISGTATVGQELTCERGTWSGVPSPTFAYQWFVTEKAISGATGTTYVVPEGDQTKQIACEVTASNSAGEETAKSAAVTVAGTAPKNTKLPSISGVDVVEEKLTCSPGEWKADPEAEYSFEWLLNGSVIGRKSQLVVPQEAEGETLVCAVTAKNSAGSLRAESAPVVIAKKGGTAPKNTSAPSVSDADGDAVGDAVACSTGTWTGEQLTYYYQWLREGAAIEGATKERYTVATADQGHSLSCRVEAADAYGEAIALSSNSLAIPGEAPGFSGPAVIEGTARVGETLRCVVGAVTGEPTPTVSYQWLIEGKVEASGQSLAIAATDAEHSLACKVTAENTAGKATSTSTSVPVPGVAPVAPPAEDYPRVLGEPVEGATLECDNDEAKWGGAPAPTFTYAWLLDGVPLGKPSTGRGYVVISEDLGHSLSCEVIARNGSGEASVVSASVSVLGRAPSNTSAPTIEGTPGPGELLTCTSGDWTAEPPIEEQGGFSYEWLSDGKSITGGRTDQLVVETDEIGKTIECRVTAKNEVGTTSASSAPLVITDGVTAPQVAPPTVSGTPELGQQLTCEPGSVEGVPTPTISYQWLTNGTPIEGQTAQTYVVVTTDEGYNVTCEVLAENTAGTGSASSSNAAHVRGVAPLNTKPPEVAGEPYAGETIACESGEWGNPKPKPQIGYEWLLDGTPIPGATKSKYLVEGSELGQSISCSVTVTNTEGTASAVSANSFVIAVKPVHKFEREVPSEEVPTPKKGKPPAPPSAAQILQALAAQLASVEDSAHVRALLKKGTYSFAFDALTAGTLQLTWTAAPKGAHASAKGKSAIIATASLTFSGASKDMVKLRLTSQGRRAIRASKRLKVTARGVFTAEGQSPVTWLKSFVLTR